MINNKYKMKCEYMCASDSDIWLASNPINILYHINLNSGIKKEYAIPFIERRGSYCSGIFVNGHRICIVPGNTNRFIIFDVLSERFFEMPLIRNEQVENEVCASWTWFGDIVYWLTNKGNFLSFDTTNFSFISNNISETLVKEEYKPYWFFTDWKNRRILFLTRNNDVFSISEKGEINRLLEDMSMVVGCNIFFKNNIL